ncbi:MAG TPA: hypothetical protein VKR06_30510 [Ktedonosporobacter sp.]|nr:hypothetical protein [Ktedonosporobacter sp.]
MLELQRRRDQLAAQAPKDIVTERLPGERGATVYRFSHQLYGPLGQLHITPVPFMQACSIDVDMAESDPDKDEHWREKYQALKTIVDLCVQALPGSIPGESPLPPMDEARKRRSLYLRFLAAGNSIEMLGLAKSLTQTDYQLLLSTCEAAQRTASPSDRAGIEQRLGELRFYWKDLQERPIVE